ncbi:hypothetical protein VACV_TT12_023 [Vaccinia virus]|uniref:Uncharacterized protein n=1 Tax=Vaccinia virus TaxID=10245 RepID=M9WLG1_VACCV|nr:hypothetical protein VACV_TT12_023 [Vaccinia virus]
MDLARLGSMSSYDFSTVVSVLLVSIRSMSRSIESKHDRSEDNEYLYASFCTVTSGFVRCLHRALTSMVQILSSLCVSYSSLL